MAVLDQTERNKLPMIRIILFCVCCSRRAAGAAWVAESNRRRVLTWGPCASIPRFRCSGGVVGGAEYLVRRRSRRSCCGPVCVGMAHAGTYQPWPRERRHALAGRRSRKGCRAIDMACPRPPGHAKWLQQLCRRMIACAAAAPQSVATRRRPERRQLASAPCPSARITRLLGLRVLCNQAHAPTIPRAGWSPMGSAEAVASVVMGSHACALLLAPGRLTRRADHSRHQSIPPAGSPGT